MRRVSYHQNVFDLLDVEPRISPEAARMVADWERRMRLTLPASVRDWYTLQDVVPLTLGEEMTAEYGYLWHDYSNEDHPTALDRVLADWDAASRLGTSQDPGYVTVLEENQGCNQWIIRLGDEDDPPVWVDLETDNGRQWTIIAERFSTFLMEWFWESYQEPWTPVSHNPSPVTEPVHPRWPKRPKLYINGLWLRSPRDEALLPPHVDYLIEQATEEPQQLPRGGGVTAYRFTLPEGHVRVTSDDHRNAEGRSAWWLHAHSPEALTALARRVLHIGTLDQTLTSATEPGKKALRTLLGRE